MSMSKNLKVFHQNMTVPCLYLEIKHNFAKNELYSIDLHIKIWQVLTVICLINHLSWNNWHHLTSKWLLILNVLFQLNRVLQFWPIGNELSFSFSMIGWTMIDFFANVWCKTGHYLKIKNYLTIKSTYTMMNLKISVSISHIFRTFRIWKPETPKEILFHHARTNCTPARQRRSDKNRR